MAHNHPINQTGMKAHIFISVIAFYNSQREVRLFVPFTPSKFWKTLLKSDFLVVITCL